MGANNANFHSCLVIAVSRSSDSLLMCVCPNKDGSSGVKMGLKFHLGQAVDRISIVVIVCIVSLAKLELHFPEFPTPSHGSWLGSAMGIISARFGRSVLDYQALL